MAAPPRTVKSAVARGRPGRGATHTNLRVLIESVPAVPTGELLPHSNAN